MMVPTAANTEIAGSAILVGGVSAVGKVGLYAVDPDGNLIVGPGAPSFNFAAQPTNGWSASMSANVLSLGTSSTFASAKFNDFTITLQSTSCTEPNAHCSFPVLLDVRPMLAMADTADSKVYVLLTNRANGAMPTYAVVSNGVATPSNAKFDGVGNLYVANEGNVTVYAPPYTGAPVTTISLTYIPEHFAVSPAGYVAVAGTLFTTDSFSVYSPPSYASPVTVDTTPNVVSAIAFNFGSGLWVATNQLNIYFYPAGATTSTVSFSSGRVAAMDVDKAGDVVSVDPTQLLITKFSPPSYSAGASTAIQGVNPSTVKSLNTTSVVCTSAGAALYSAALALSGLTPISGTTACSVTASYLAGDYWLEAPASATQSQLYGSSTSAVVPFPANSIDAYPAPWANY
jgi:hypothetical protein